MILIMMKLWKKVSWADSVLIGPGLGRHPTTKLLIEKLVKSINKPLVLDADGLYPFFGRLNDLSKRKYPLIITPHFGEFSYLCDINKNDIISEFSKVMDSKIKKFHHVILVKQIPICTFSNNSATVNISGNPDVATAGTGDVLAGMIASFIAQGFSFDSATMAAYIHGKASDKLLETKGYRGQLASDLLDYIPLSLSDMNPHNLQLYFYMILILFGSSIPGRAIPLVLHYLLGINSFMFVNILF